MTSCSYHISLSLPRDIHTLALAPASSTKLHRSHWVRQHDISSSEGTEPIPSEASMRIPSLPSICLERGLEKMLKIN